MAKKTMVDEIIDGVKNAAGMSTDAPEAKGDKSKSNEPQGKLYERIVRVPHADVYSELPFELVETGGEPTSAASRHKKAAPAPARPPSKKPAAKKPAAKKAAKKPAGKAAKKATKR